MWLASRGLATPVIYRRQNLLEFTIGTVTIAIITQANSRQLQILRSMCDPVQTEEAS
jgi:hypothetical protein